MKILISGSTGFIGKHLVKRLLSKKYDIYAIVRNTKDSNLLGKEKSFIFSGDTEKLVSFMQKEKFDGVIHLASLFLASHKADDIKDLINSNVFLGTAILEASVKSNVKWFLNTGTFWQHYNNKDYSPVNLYAATKQAFEDIAKYYTETSKINFATIKLSDTFGENDTRPKI
jgi:CDP-paratose synthetase